MSTPHAEPPAQPAQREQPVRTGRAVRGPERFLSQGRLVTLPRRASDKDLVRRYLVARVLPVGAEMDERELTGRLAELADDPAGVRRGLIDAGVLGRSPDGARYWRTAVTEFD